MARPTKAACSTSNRHTTEQTTRKQKEETLRSSGTLNPPRHLSKDQKKIWKFIVEGLEQADVLCSLDSCVLELASVSIDRIQKINKTVNEDPELLCDRDVRGTIDQYTKIFFRVCNELCLSPQSRAKLANAMVQAESPAEQLKKILSDDEDEGE